MKSEIICKLPSLYKLTVGSAKKINHFTFQMNKLVGAFIENVIYYYWALLVEIMKSY